MNRNDNHTHPTADNPGFTCRVCGKRKPKHAFPGKGRRGYICLDCAKVPLGQRISSQQEEEIFHYMRQAKITEETIARLQVLQASRNEKVTHLAALVLEVAAIKPYRKGRLKELARENRELLDRLRHAGLVMTP
jgi:hypothetical protein